MSRETGEIIGLTARGVGAFAAAATALLWIAAMWAPSMQAVLSGWSFAVASMMAFFAIFAVIASVRGHGNVMLAMFLASFLPVGAYLIRVDHWLRWVGVLNLILLLAALFTRWAAAKVRTAA